MTTYLIYRGDRIFGMVVDGPNGPKIETQNAELRDVLERCLKEPASEMTGGQIGDIMYDGIRSYNPGTPDHTRAVLTGGTLIQYGWKGVLQP